VGVNGYPGEVVGPSGVVAVADALLQRGEALFEEERDAAKGDGRS
jgi:hypothetical protein